MEAKTNSRLSEARRNDIIETAWSIFLEQGYSGASMAEISQRLGGSKATLYNYFPSKELLFREVILRNGEELYARLNAIPFDFADLRTGLIEFGIRLLRVVTSEQYVTVHRLVIAESDRFSHLDQDDFDTRRDDVLKPLSRRIAEQMDAGVLRQADPLDASEAFWNLCNGSIHRLALMTANLRLDTKRMRDIAERATNIFLAAYAPQVDSADRQIPAGETCG